MLVLASTLGWLGWTALDQERELAARRRRALGRDLDASRWPIEYGAVDAGANQANVQSLHRGVASFVTICSFTMISAGGFSPFRIVTAISTLALPIS